MDLLLEDNAVTAIYNTCKNRKDKCDYLCGEKFMNDKFMQPKLNVCRANCDVVWEQEYIRNLKQYIASNGQNMDAGFVSDLRNRLTTANKRLISAKKRLLKTKMILKKELYGRRADMSMRLTKPGPTFES
jgi:hypothetical protein